MPKWFAIYIAIQDSWLFVANLFDAIVWNNPPEMIGHLWYIGALIWSIGVFYLLLKVKKEKLLAAFTVAGLICLMVFGKYSKLIFGKDIETFYTKNWFCPGIPFVTIGF